MVRVALTALLFGITAAVLWASGDPNDEEDFLLEFSTVLTLLLLISPISWTHYYLLLLLPVVFLASRHMTLGAGRGWRLALAVAAVAVMLPVRVVPLSSPIARLLSERVFMSHYFLGGLLLLAMLLRWRWMHRSVQYCATEFKRGLAYE
jgi:hypothetical protein